MLKIKLFCHFCRRGYGPKLAFKLARKRYDDTNLAARMLKSNAWSK